MYNVFPATRESLDPVGTAQSIDGAKRALGSLLNVFNGTLALPAHWHLRDEIIFAGTDAGRIGGGGDRAPPSPSDSTMPIIDIMRNPFGRNLPHFQ